MLSVAYTKSGEPASPFARPRLKVSFIIPHQQNLGILKAAVRSIEEQQLPPEASVEVIIVDNASSAHASAWADDAGHRGIRLPANQGFGRAVNRGIEDASGDLVVVMNDDVELAPDWLGRAAAALEEHSAWFVCGKLLQHGSPETIDGVGDALARGGAAWRLGHGRPDAALFAEPRGTFFPSATAVLFKREFFDRVGLYDETLFAYLEDVDLGLRAALSDLPGRYAPRATALHRGSATGKSWSPAMVRWITAHQLLLIAKYYSLATLLRYGWRIASAQALWAALAFSRARAGAWLRGLGLALTLAPGIRQRGGELRRDPNRLQQVLMDSEAEIAHFQLQTEVDGYWRWYFRLTGWPQETQQ